MFSRTERLLLRPGWAEDAPELARTIADPAIIRNLMEAPWPYGVADAQRYLAMQEGKSFPDFLIFKRTKGAPKLIGGCGITARQNGSPELGYWIARRYWGLGFATEAASAVMRIARASGLKRITASHFHDNPASGSVLRKLGFHPTGRVEKRHSPARDRAADVLLFEEGETVPMRADLSAEIYRDRVLVAA